MIDSTTASQRQPVKALVERGSDSGFALLIVIWISGVLALLAVSFASSARVHVKLAANTLANANAQWLAEAGVQIGVLNLLASHARTNRLEPSIRVCRLPDGDAVVLTVTDEAGRIDINVAGADLIAALLIGTGVNTADAARLTDAILDYRDGDDDRRPNGAEAADYQASNVATRPKNGPFDTVRELNGVLGMTRDIFVAISPYVTVHSGQEGIDWTVAPVGLVDVLERGTGRASPARPTITRDQPVRGFSIVSTRQAVLIRASVVTTTGTTFVREAVVSVAPKRQQPPASTEPDPGFGSVARSRRPSGLGQAPTAQDWRAQVWDWRAPAITDAERRQLSNAAALPWC